MKENELRESAKCGVCGNFFGHTGIPLFWRITVERFGIDMKAVQRQDGLAQLLGGSQLANIMGTDEDMTKPMMDPVKVTICEDCIIKPVIIAMLAEKGEQNGTQS